MQNEGENVLLCHDMVPKVTAESFVKETEQYLFHLMLEELFIKGSVALPACALGGFQDTA